mmetsp:Transcript_20019/g.51986  ORF Transcript_20019/g.51986 Transcript_20019/m.51986 type:complete len:129 (+) Transcript_20019:1-387(+)
MPQTEPPPPLFGGAYGRVLDSVWIVQPNHGPFDASDPPSTCAPGACVGKGVSYDHWRPLLGLGDPTGSHTDTMAAFVGREAELLERFRAGGGDGQWMRSGYDLLAGARGTAGGGDAVWEDLGAEGNEP